MERAFQACPADFNQFIISSVSGRFQSFHHFKRVRAISVIPSFQACPGDFNHFKRVRAISIIVPNLKSSTFLMTRLGDRGFFVGKAVSQKMVNIFLRRRIHVWKNT
jgi:hypothetical protein